MSVAALLSYVFRDKLFERDYDDGWDYEPSESVAKSIFDWKGNKVLVDEYGPAYDTALAASLVGKYILVGFTDVDDDEKQIGQHQIHGRISIVNAHQGVCIELKGVREGEVYWMPPDLKPFKWAKPGVYRLRSTGEVVTNPDILAKWISQKCK